MKTLQNEFVLKTGFNRFCNKLNARFLLMLFITKHNNSSNKTNKKQRAYFESCTKFFASFDCVEVMNCHRNAPDQWNQITNSPRYAAKDHKHLCNRS